MSKANPYVLGDEVARQDQADAARAFPKLGGSVPRIDRLRRIVESRQAARTEGRFVDLFSASAYVRAWEALSQENRAKLDSMPIARALGVVFALAGRRA